MKRFTVTTGDSMDDLVMFETDDFAETKVNAKYVNVSLNFVITREALEKALEEQD